MASPRHELDDLAAHILDQGEVDWTRVSADVRLAEPDTLDGLRLLEDLARGFRHTLVGGDAQNARRGDAVLFRFAGLEVRERLGRGGQGEVYRAYDPLLDQEVALKLRPADSDALAHQFIAEARRLVRVRHPNVVSVFGAALDGGRVGLWMERVRGETLGARLAPGPLSAEETAILGAELCAALAAVHRHGLVHGDVKAENVLCEPGGRVVLADFGAAREAGDSASLTVSGTLRYLAPELLRGEAATPASDLYSLGVLLYLALSGRYPRQGESVEALLREQEGMPPPALRSVVAGVPRGLARAVERCLDADPRRRPSSALALARQLEQALAPRRARLPRLAWAAMALALVAAIGLLLWPRALPTWTPELSLLRRSGVTLSAIASGSAVQRGDGLQLSWRSDRPAWLYVLDDDGTGAAVLFPLSGAETQNPLSAGITHTLPRSGTQALAWTISGDAAREEILVIAARAPLPELEALLDPWQRSAVPAGARRGAAEVRPAEVPDTLDSERLRHALALALRQDGVRSWRFALPHAP